MEEEKISPEYLKGFNNGYQMAKHESDLLENLLKSVDNLNGYFTGMEAGRQQFKKEELIQEMKSIRENNKAIRRKH